MEREDSHDYSVQEGVQRAADLKEAFGEAWKVDPATGKPVLPGEPGYESIVENKFEPGEELIEETQTLGSIVKDFLSGWIRE
jgi:hypothetical protein